MVVTIGPSVPAKMIVCPNLSRPFTWHTKHSSDQATNWIKNIFGILWYFLSLKLSDAS